MVTRRESEANWGIEYVQMLAGASRVPTDVVYHWFLQRFGVLQIGPLGVPKPLGVLCARGNRGRKQRLATETRYPASSTSRATCTTIRVNLGKA